MLKPLQNLSLLLVAGLGLGSVSAVGQQLLYEPFDGTGVLNGYNGWAKHSGTADQLTRVDGSLTYTGLPASTGNKLVLKSTDSEDVNKLFESPIETGSVYASTLLKVVDGASISPNTSEGNYFMHFQKGVGNTPFVARVYIRAGSAPNTFNVGILNNSPVPTSTAEMYGDSPVDYVVGQTYLIVTKYDIATNTSSVWVNPALDGTEPAPLVTDTGGDPNPSITGLAIRQSLSNGLNTGDIEIDEVRAGTTFASVTPSTLGVRDFSSANIGLYPNPTTGAAKLQLPTSLSAKGNVALTVYSLEGRVMLKAAGSEQTLNAELSNKLNAAAAGVYLVRIDADGGSYQTRIVKN